MSWLLCFLTTLSNNNFMDKKIVFISHITEEKELAVKVKELIETSFLGMIEVFVSSDEHSISLGQKWLDNITKALKTCSIEIILCSHNSITRPWINFEAGAGWIRDIPVIPLCHSGLTPSKLPMPLNLLQAATANEVSSLKLLFPVLAQALGSKTPEVDYETFTKAVKELEKKYTFWTDVNKGFEILNSHHTQIISVLKTGKTIEIDLTESDEKKLDSAIQLLKPHDLVDLKRLGTTKITTGGTFYGFNIIPLKQLANIFKDTNCKW